MTEDQFIDIRQASHRAAVSRSTVKRWIDEGRLTRYHTATRRVRVLQSELQALCTPRKVDAYQPERD